MFIPCVEILLAKRVFSEEDFKTSDPYLRGYVVYCHGKNGKQPNIPDESNPYETGSEDWLSWNRGWNEAYLDVQDLDE